MKQILENETAYPIQVFDRETYYMVRTIACITFNNWKSWRRVWVKNAKSSGKLFLISFLIIFAVIYFLFALEDEPVTYNGYITISLITLAFSIVLSAFKLFSGIPSFSQNFPIGKAISFEPFYLAKNNSYLTASINKHGCKFIVGDVLFGECKTHENGRFILEKNALKYMGGVGGATPYIVFPLLQRLVRVDNGSKGGSMYLDTSNEPHAFVAALNHVHGLSFAPGSASPEKAVGLAGKDINPFD